MSESPKVLVLGAGSVGTSLALSLRLAGAQVLGIWGRSPEALAIAAANAQVPGVSGTAPPVALCHEAEILIVAVRDSAIAEVAVLLENGGHLAQAPIILHCSGAVSGEQAFAGVQAKLGGRGLIHPLRALPRGLVVESFRNTTFGVQGDAGGLAAATRLCELLGGRALSLEANQMPGYHAAAVMASNYLVALLDVAIATAEASGLDATHARLGLLELAEGALAGVRRSGTLAALSGPIRRGDLAPVAEHMQALAAALPTATDLYSEMGRWTIAMSRRCGDASEAELTAIERLLAKSG